MTILIVVLIIIAIPFIAALFLKRDYTIEREIVINKPKQEVFSYIKLIRNQDHYSKWAMMDLNAKKEYKGVDGTPGFFASWKSDNKQVGQGEQTITNIVDGERLDIGLHFIKPFEGKANAYMTTEPVAQDQTKTKWGFNGKMKYPMNLMIPLMKMEKMISNDLDIGLNNLKNVLEKP